MHEAGLDQKKEHLLSIQNEIEKIREQFKYDILGSGIYVNHFRNSYVSFVETMIIELRETYYKLELLQDVISEYQNDQN